MTSSYRFDSFLLNPATRELREGAELLVLPARALDCLVYLIEHRDRAVGRDELIAAVWGRSEISDALLSHMVVKIRRSLGDTGNEQRTIRTVPRFGYRWVAGIEVVASLPVQVPTAPAVEVAAPDMVVQSAQVERKAAPPSKSRRFGWLALGSLAVIAIAVAMFARRPASLPADVTSAPPPHVAPDVEVIVAPALVLPAEVTAPDDWRWLRFGVMDLVATRLRDGALHTMPSENVVALLKQRDAAGSHDDLLHDPRLAKVAALRVLPRVRVEDNRWSVRLDAFGVQTDLNVEAQAGDPITAARDAADQLLRKLGRKLNVVGIEPSSPELDELLQRSGAAMLADQLDQARELIRAAPPQLQQQPRVEQRMAQIELRIGDYAATETRLHALLDRLSPQRDAALRARALLTLAVAYMRQNKPDSASELYEEAIALRQEQGDAEVLGVAYLGRGVVLAQKSHLDEATSELSRARIELATVGDGLGVASVDVNLGEFQRMRHRPAEALPQLKNAAREFEQLGAREGLAYALEQQAGVEREVLDFMDALATTGRFWPPESHTSNVRLRWTLVCARAEALTSLGQLDEALALVARVRTDSDPRADAVARACVEALAANISWRRGDAASAARFAGDALTQSLRDAQPTLYARTSALRVRALLRGGHSEEAAAQVRSLRAWIGADTDGWRLMYVTLADAEVAWAARRKEPALGQFAAALQRAIEFNVPEDLVVVAVPYLDALIETSQLDAARVVGGRIAPWADRDLRVASAQARLFRALGQDDAARKAEENASRLSAGNQPPSRGELP